MKGINIEDALTKGWKSGRCVQCQGAGVAHQLEHAAQLVEQVQVADSQSSINEDRLPLRKVTTVAGSSSWRHWKAR